MPWLWQAANVDSSGQRSSPKGHPVMKNSSFVDPGSNKQADAALQQMETAPNKRAANCSIRTTNVIDL
jgi:hypothetical protein